MQPSLFYILLLLFAPASGRSSTTVAHPIDVLNYRVTLRLEPDTRYLQGETQITVRHDAEVQELTLAFGEMNVEEVQVNAKGVPFSHHDAHLVVPLPGSDTTSVVHIRYNGVPDTGLYAKAYKGQRVVFTDSWTNRGRGWLPD